jgi:hypothetical protein
MEWVNGFRDDGVDVSMTSLSKHFMATNLSATGQ